MNARILRSLIFVATTLGVACLDMSAPKGPSSISLLQLPSPSVVIGDVMRDSNGVPAPLGVIAFDANGTPIGGVTSQVYITDSSHVAHLDANHNLTGDRLGVVHLIGQIGSLQTAVAAVPVTSAPYTFAKTTTTDTLAAPFPTDSASSIKSDTFKVSLKGIGDSASQGFIVRYVLDSAPPSLPSSKGPGVYLASSNGKPSLVDTTNAAGIASHVLVVNSLALADSALLGGTKVDSAVVRAFTSYKGALVAGAPLRFVIYIKVTFGK